MATVSFAGFRTFLEKYEAKTEKDKEEARERSDDRQPMDSLGGEEYHFMRGPKKTKASTYRKIKKSDPQLSVNTDLQDPDLKANYVPLQITPGLRGGKVEPIDAGYSMQATDGSGRDLDPDEILARVGKRHMRRKDMTSGVYDRWAAAAAGGAAGAGPGPAPGPM